MMNIKQKKKENNELQNQTKKIGDEYEQIIEVRCLVCKKVLEYEQDEDINNLVISILNAPSESEKSNKKAWEEDIATCEHALTLKQNEEINIEEKNKNKCSNCDLKSNLWLCLTCGNISCGRKETGGNEHAIEHFKKSGHPLVVKIGTISNDSEASLYCYSCDNDVKDENLATHLQVLGIDISSQKKTEKTITEMNLSLQLNLTLSKTIEEGKVLTPLYGPGFTGLENIGNSCYMNSIIQILFNLQPFKERYFNNALEHLNICTRDSSDCFLCQMSKISYGLHSGIYSQKKTKILPLTEEKKEGETEEYQDGIRPSSFKLYFGKGNHDFSSNKQQDAFEYLGYLLEKMRKNEKKYRKFDPMQLFEFDLEERMECNDCHIVKYKNTRSWFLSFSVDDWEKKKEEIAQYSMDEALKKFLSQEVVELNCPECKKKVSWTKTQRILNYPQYLIIMLQRFVFDKNPVKLEVSFEPTVNNLDIKILSQSQKKENEKILDLSKEKDFEKEESEKEKQKLEEKEEFEEQDIQFNQNDIDYLLQCGVTEIGAKWSLYLCNHDREQALCFYCENSENPDYKKPLPKIKVKKGKNDLDMTGVKLESLSTLIEMGFERRQAIAALKRTFGNIEEAINLIYIEPDIGKESKEEKMDIEDKKEDKKIELEEDNKIINEGNGSIYDLYGFITHLGKNTEQGHYVAHIKQEGNKWTYFNDNKVALWESPPIKKGYIFFYRNISNKNK